MLIRIMSLAFNSLTGGFDDTEVRSFIQDKEVISIQDHFFTRNEVPFLTLIIRYFSGAVEGNSAQAHPSQVRRDEEWKGLLLESDMGLFNILREWRSKQCRKEGVPPYVLFTNKQLALIVKAKPQSLADLAKTDGVGTSKVEKYGQDILALTVIQSVSNV